MEKKEIQRIYQIMGKQFYDTNRNFDDLSKENIYLQHAKLINNIANFKVHKEGKNYIIDDNNKLVLKFLLYYFNNCDLALSVFPDKHYRLNNNLLICGNVGTGKTLLMQIFSEYLRLTNNPNYFQNIPISQMINHYTMYNNLNPYTYNEEVNSGFRINPYNICLNDIGVTGKMFFGMNTKVLTDEFLHARNEIWLQYGKFAHITTNLDVEHLKKEFDDGFGRLIDRFKTYNVIPLTGESRR